MFKKKAKKEMEELKELTAEEVIDQYEKDEMNEADLEWIAGGAEYISPKVPEDEDKKKKLS